MNRALTAAAVVVGGIAAYLLATRGEAAYGVPEVDAGASWLAWPSWDSVANDMPSSWAAVDPLPLTETYADMVDSVGGGSVAERNIAAVLMTIRVCEGTSGPNGYRTMFGGSLFNSFADHPRKRFQFTQTDGKVNYTDAAGAYQYLSTTWDGVRAKLGLPDFSPASQDAGAIELIREKGALDDVRAGRFDVALGKLGTVWASLPSSKYQQRTRTVAFARQAYESAGGVYA